MAFSDRISIFWFRRDLRLDDNAALYYALRDSRAPVLPLFIFDTNILDDLENRSDPRVTFIYNCIQNIDRRLKSEGSGLLLKYGDPITVWEQLFEAYEIDTVYTNQDYEPYAISRDSSVSKLLESHGTRFELHKDQVIFDGEEVLKDDKTPYTVFTPYKRKWLQRLQESRVGQDYDALRDYPSYLDLTKLFRRKMAGQLSLEEMGFGMSDMDIPSPEIDIETIRNYDKHRDYPARQGTTLLGIHLRFGTISIRELARVALKLNETYLSELIWRDFYSQILSHFPHVVSGPFREKYSQINWRNDPEDFEKWCKGKTGYPLVDAGMRQLNMTGYMHNRVRMVTASFLTKHLLINWQMGEAYFAEKLLDFDLASNNGGWQWAAGCGTDAAPYFRIFNPTSQLKKFDSEGTYVKQWISELQTLDYPQPMIDHKFARERCLKTYKEALS